MAQGKKVTKSIYNCIKTLLNGGATNKEICEYMKLSDETIRRIKKSETYEEYLQISYSLSGAFYKKRRLEREAAEKKAAEEDAARKAEAAKVAEKVGAVPAAQIIQLPAQTQKPISMTIQATHFMETKLDQVLEILKIMNNKLGAIIDDLYGTGKGADAK